MRYQKELAALREYITNFDPERFTSSTETVLSMARTAEQIDRAKRIREALKRKRQRLDAFNMLLNQGGKSPEDEIMITQDDVDALLEGWSPHH